MENLKEAKDYFEVLDVLAGDITGDYQGQLQQIEQAGITCSESLYYQAYQASEQA